MQAYLFGKHVTAFEQGRAHSVPNMHERTECTISFANHTNSLHDFIRHNRPRSIFSAHPLDPLMYSGSTNVFFFSLQRTPLDIVGQPYPSDTLRLRSRSFVQCYRMYNRSHHLFKGTEGHRMSSLRPSLSGLKMPGDTGNRGGACDVLARIPAKDTSVSKELVR